MGDPTPRGLCHDKEAARDVCGRGAGALCFHTPTAVRSPLQTTRRGMSFLAPTTLLRDAPIPSMEGLSDIRMSAWCRRLWALSTAGGPGVDTKATIKHRKKKEAEAKASFLFNPDHQEERIQELEQAIQSEHGHLPAVLVEQIWEVYHAVLPPDVESDLRVQQCLPYAQHFFTLMHLLTSLDCDLEEISAKTKSIQAYIAEYKDSLEVMQGIGHTAAHMAERSKLDAKLVALRQRIVEACGDVRHAGTPLYYAWLRYTGSMENGIRRLMNFRKIIHAFDIICKSRVREMEKQLDDSLPSFTKLTEEAKEEIATGLKLWQARKHDMGLLDGALTYLFHDFFSKEYLVMEELTWFTTPPALLERIMAAEGVHPFHRGLVDMKDRLQPQHHRHLFAFLHPAVVEEPLIAVQVALTKGISISVDHILHRPTPLANPVNASVAAQAYQRHVALYGEDTSDSEQVDTAIFYSINSAQSALRGMDMGNRLIKRVVREIDERINASRRVRQLSPIVHFSTLSPIPGFNRWLKGEIDRWWRLLEGKKAQPGDRTLGQSVFGPGDASMIQLRFLLPLREALLDYAGRYHLDDQESFRKLREVAEQGSSTAATNPSATQEGLINVQTLTCLSELFLGTPDGTKEELWYLDPIFTTRIETPLLRCVGHYLFQEKKTNGRIRDPVGNFHISNGAQMYRLNFLANATPQGSRESACTMVNYLYDIPSISANVKQYEIHREVCHGNFFKYILSNQAEYQKGQGLYRSKQ